MAAGEAGGGGAGAPAPPPAPAAAGGGAGGARPARRVRHVRRVAARGLLPRGARGGGGGAAAGGRPLGGLAARCVLEVWGAGPGGEGWGEVWRSEVCRGTLNPEWDSLGPPARGGGDLAAAAHLPGPVRVRVFTSSCSPPRRGAGRAGPGAGLHRLAGEAGGSVAAGGALPGEELALEAVVNLQELHELPPLQEGGAAALPPGANVLFVLSDKRLYSAQPLITRRGAPAPGGEGAGPGPGSEPPAKFFDVEDATVDIMRLKGAKADLRAAQERLETLRSELEERLSRHAAAQNQVLCRAESSLLRQQLIRRRERLEAQVAAEVGALRGRCELHRERSEALRRQRQALQRGSAGASLAAGPPQLAASLEDIYLTLNTRRWQLVSCLAEVYCAAPILGEAFDKLLKNAKRVGIPAGSPAGGGGSPPAAWRPRRARSSPRPARPWAPPSGMRRAWCSSSLATSTSRCATPYAVSARDPSSATQRCRPLPRTGPLQRSSTPCTWIRI